jgi:outer membrane lipoprotein-sorting protein
MNDFPAVRTRCAPAASRVIAVRRAPLARRAGNLIVAAGALLAWSPALFASASSPTVQEVLASSLAARGGAQKLKAITTRREIGTLGLGAGNEWPFVVEHKRPNLMRMEIELQGTKLIRVFDGARGWQKQPQSPAPEQLAGDDLHNIANEADFDNALIDTAAKGKAELLGKEPIGGAAGAGGKPAYKVQVTLKNGDLFYYYIDAASYLPIHWEGSRMISGKPVLFESDFNDYREAGGVKYPFQIVSSIKGSVQKQKITFTKIEINPPIDDARFTPASMALPPATAPAPTPPAAAPPAAAAPATPPPTAATTPPPSPPPARVPAGFR